MAMTMTLAARLFQPQIMATSTVCRQSCNALLCLLRNKPACSRCSVPSQPPLNLPLSPRCLHNQSTTTTQQLLLRLLLPQLHPFQPPVAIFSLLTHLLNSSVRQQFNTSTRLVEDEHVTSTRTRNPDLPEREPMGHRYFDAAALQDMEV